MENTLKDKAFCKCFDGDVDRGTAGRKGNPISRVCINFGMLIITVPPTWKN